MSLLPTTFLPLNQRRCFCRTKGAFLVHRPNPLQVLPLSAPHFSLPIHASCPRGHAQPSRSCSPARCQLGPKTNLISIQQGVSERALSLTQKFLTSTNSTDLHRDLSWSFFFLVFVCVSEFQICKGFAITWSNSLILQMKLIPSSICPKSQARQRIMTSLILPSTNSCSQVVCLLFQSNNRVPKKCLGRSWMA